MHHVRRRSEKTLQVETRNAQGLIRGRTLDGGPQSTAALLSRASQHGLHVESVGPATDGPGLEFELLACCQGDSVMLRVGDLLGECGLTPSLMIAEAAA